MNSLNIAAGIPRPVAKATNQDHRWQHDRDWFYVRPKTPSSGVLSFANLALNAKYLAHVCMWSVSFIVPTLLARGEMTVTCSDNPDHSVTTCRIDQPVVTQEAQHGKAYPVTFRPGDLVTIAAGGCVQTGGWGSTWKRYVDPKGPKADRLYHGTIWIP